MTQPAESGAPEEKPEIPQPKASGVRHVGVRSMALLATVLAIGGGVLSTQINGGGGGNTPAGHEGEASSSAAKPASTFPCPFTWSLATNMAPGKVEAGASSSCAGKRGSLTISVKLEKQDPATKQWHVLRQQTKTWKNPNGRHFVVLLAPCQVATYRANFDWKLKNTAGRVVAHNHVKTGPQFLGC